MDVYCPNCGSDDCHFNPRFSSYQCSECNCSFEDDDYKDTDAQEPDIFSNWDDNETE